MNWLSRQMLGLLSGSVLASANYGCSREPEPGLAQVEIEAASRAFRRIDTKSRAGANKRTRLIRSQKSLDAYFMTASMERRIGPRQQAFYSALRAETIDFPRELLCLYCLHLGSASITSRLGSTTLSNRHMTFRVATKHPRGIQVDAVGIDCFAVIIDSSAVDTFAWEVNGVENYSVDLTKPTPAE